MIYAAIVLNRNTHARAISRRRFFLSLSFHITYTVLALILQYYIINGIHYIVLLSLSNIYDSYDYFFQHHRTLFAWRLHSVYSVTIPEAIIFTSQRPLLFRGDGWIFIYIYYMDSNLIQSVYNIYRVIFDVN